MFGTPDKVVRCISLCGPAACPPACRCEGLLFEEAAYVLQFLVFRFRRLREFRRFSQEHQPDSEVSGWHRWGCQGIHEHRTARECGFGWSAGVWFAESACEIVKGGVSLLKALHATLFFPAPPAITRCFAQSRVCVWLSN